jgi:hypothetical protein
MTPQGFYDAMRFFGEPKIPDGVDQSVILKAYRSELDRYAPDVLALGAEMMLKSRKHRNFPLPEECRRACVDAQNELAERRLRDAEDGASKAKADREPWAPWRISLADRMMNSVIGRLAADEDWIVHLHDWCRENGRMPNGYEGERVRGKGLNIRAERERLAGQAARMPVATAIGRIVHAVASARAKKHARLAALAFGKDAA